MGGDAMRPGSITKVTFILFTPEPSLCFYFTLRQSVEGCTTKTVFCACAVPQLFVQKAKFTE